MHDPELMGEILKKHLGPVEWGGQACLPSRESQNGGKQDSRPHWVWAGMAALACLLLVLIPWGRSNHIRSADPGEVRGWVKARTGETFALRNHAPDGVQLTGAYVTGAAAVVTFAVGGRPGTVRVLRNAGGHKYVVEAASAEDEKRACLLCHGTEVN